MTYLEIVNEVLVRMREDTASTLQGQSDNVILVVMAAVRDAAHRVQTAHQWNALSLDTTAAATAGSSTITVATNDEKYVDVESIYRANGERLKQINRAELHHRRATQQPTGNPGYWAVDGVTSTGVKISLFPTPTASETLTVYGHEKPTPLSGDDDALVVPYMPVLQLAMAIASAERGEIGGQPTAELFMIADRYLSDAVALDASMTLTDDIWYS